MSQVDELTLGEILVTIRELDQEVGSPLVHLRRLLRTEDRHTCVDPVLAIDLGDDRTVLPSIDVVLEQVLAEPLVIPDPCVLEHLLELHVRNGIAVLDVAINFV